MYSSNNRKTTSNPLQTSHHLGPLSAPPNYPLYTLVCHSPRLPMPVRFAAQYAYVGSQTLSALRAEWGVEVVAAPGPEVDPGLLQLQRVIPGNAMVQGEGGMEMRIKDMPQARRIQGTG